jgi:hypothetical protein
MRLIKQPGHSESFSAMLRPAQSLHLNTGGVLRFRNNQPA